ncbi:MAG: tRNA preQ1(34) S-adenosylmethionine ribosyltransferase-isomerase QueA [Patescibacteria group bacterium]
MPLSDFDFYLPAGLIGQKPIKPRDAARLLILDKVAGRIKHRHFFDLPGLLRSDDVLVFNDSKVIPARLPGVKDTGGRVEVFLLKKIKESKSKAGKQQKNVWQCLIGGKIKSGQKIVLAKNISARAISKDSDQTWLMEFNAGDRRLFALGETPLPPYIKTKAKLEDYQTVYAKEAGSVAAPTAGLHFTRKLLGQLKKGGVKIEYVTLHVGLGTFAPVKVDNLLEHKMHAERAEIDAATAKRLNRFRAEGRRIIAVGTTAARTLEAMADSSGRLRAGNRLTDIFIYPGYKFRFVNALITNFHLPKSTLLVLVSALAGRDNILSAYREAIKKKYKFFSFGDGMMIE